MSHSPIRGPDDPASELWPVGAARVQLSPMERFIHTGASALPAPPPDDSLPFVCLSSWVLPSARLQEADINIFIHLTLGGQLGLLQTISS